MSTVRVLARPELASGFALAGLPVIEADSPADGAHRLLELAERPEVGLILVEQPLLDALPDAARATLLRRATPVVIPIARPVWRERPGEAGAYLLELLQRAIGYRLRLR